MFKPLLISFAALSTAVSAQNSTIKGTLYNQDGKPAEDVSVQILNKRTTSNERGEFTITNAPSGNHTIRLSGVMYSKKEKTLTIRSGETVNFSDTLVAKDFMTEEVTVFGASRRVQKITEAPAAISTLSSDDLDRSTLHGQTARALSAIQGVDVVQSGMNDFNVNMRGFNNSINRRVLILIDGRDPSTPLLNLVEWNSFQNNMADIKNMEVVRGPGSALYGANAYNGVINITTFAPKDVLGTRVSVTGGEFETFRADARHAMEITDNLAVKFNIGYSRQRQAWVQSRDTSASINKGSLEYRGLAPDVRGNRTGIGNIQNIDSLINEHDIASNMFATVRADYELNSTDKIVAELGYSRYKNEYFVNQTGRILIPDVEKPFVRLAYNSPRFNVQTHYYQRNTPMPQIVMNAAASSAERSDVVVIDAQWNDSFLDGKLRTILGASHEYQHVNTSVAGALYLLSPDNLHNNFSGFYGQVEYSILKNLQIVGAARVDRSTFFDTQFSPKVAVVFSPVANHTFRATFNRSFLRPSYADLYRRSPAGAPQNYAKIDSTIAAQTGVSRLGLGVTPVWNLGNPQVGVESAQSYEIGYKGIISNNIFVTVDAYYNRRENFISVPLGGLAPTVYTPVRYGNLQADSMLQASLGANYSRLARDRDGTIALITVPTNIGVVNETGLEIGVNYYPLEKLLVSANASFLSVDIQDNKVPTQNIQPNTSPRRYNFGMQYREPRAFDVGFNLRYVDGFAWVAGLVNGSVPSYAVLDVNASYDLHVLAPGLKLGVSVFNALDRRHYQIFGGTILQRYSTASLSYTF